MTTQIQGVPEGWRLVAIRKALEGEYSINTDGNAIQWQQDSNQMHVIITKIPEPLKLELGRYYRRIDGIVVGPMKFSDHGDNFSWCIKGTDQPFPRRFYNRAGITQDLQGRDIGNLVAEVPKPIPTYRAFANAAEFKPHRDKWIMLKDRSDLVNMVFRVALYSDGGYTIREQRFGWDVLLSNYTFEDGTPCGVKQ